MINISIINQFQNELVKHDAIGRFISVKHLDKMFNEISNIKKNSSNGKLIYKSYMLKLIDFKSVMSDSSLKSICIIATPSPLKIVKFETCGSIIDIEIPPIYADKRETVNYIRKITSSLFSRYGYKTVPISLPKKLLAVHSGMAKYGKNNLVYIPGMGSYHRLTAFATDVPYNDDEWNELSLLDICSSCGACQRSCPTKALDEQFIVNTNKCITAYDDYPGEFPSWLDTSRLNSLVGCTICQKACPVNKPYLKNKKTLSTFNARESELIISETPFNKLPNELKEKIRYLCLDIYYDVLARNLKILIQNSKISNVKL